MARTMVIIIFVVTTFTVKAADPNLIPWPTKIQMPGKQLTLDEQTLICADARFTNEAALLSDELHFRLSSAPVTNKNRILLSARETEGLPEEAYRLDVDPRGVTIHAHSSAGAFYGCQTLLQLINTNTPTLPFVNIVDAPRYAWRGFMLDVSRHFFDQTMIQRILDWMAGYKLNRLHLHLTDDQAWRLEIGKYPDLTRIGARGNYSDTNAPPQFFTKLEMQEIVRYAARRHIVVVPEIEMPGHAGSATRAFPQLDGGSHTIDPARPETYVFLQNVLVETMAIFPSPWIHIGGDEVNGSNWSQNLIGVPQKQTESLKSPQQLGNVFVNRMVDFIQAHGRSPAGWDEIVAAKPSPDAVVFWWRHDRPEILAQALADGHPVVLAPRSPCYFDYPQDESYPKIGRKIVNTPAAVYRGPVIPNYIPPSQLKQILGVEACVWTEHIETVSQLEFMILPRLAALAEMAWTPDSQRDFERFKTRLKPFLARYHQSGIPYYDQSNPLGSLRYADNTKAAQHLTELPMPISDKP